MARPEPSFLGRGWAFPPAFSHRLHSVAMVSGIEDIRQSLWILFSTMPGERVMVPTYGCDLWQYVFRELDATLLSEIQDTVSTAILRWETRIDLLAVAAAADPDWPGLVLITVEFAVRRTNSRGNLVYPFYLDEATLAGPP